MSLRICQMLSSKLSQPTSRMAKHINHTNHTQFSNLYQLLRCKSTHSHSAHKASIKTPLKPTLKLKPLPSSTSKTIPPTTKTSANLQSQTSTSSQISTQPPYATIEPSRKKIPERLLIYHSGTFSTTFIGVQKITSIFCLAFIVLFLAPSYAAQPEEPLWRPILIAASGILPLFIVTKATKPFVCYIHLLLPPTARSSPAALKSYTSALPTSITTTTTTTNSTATLEMTTMNAIGRPRVSRMFIRDLSALKRTWTSGAANLRRSERSVLEKERGRKWWQPRLVREFAVREGRGGVAGNREVWERVWKAVQGNTRE